MTKVENFLTDLFGLQEQIAVVIGATGVLGGALADGIAAAGATVVVSGRSAERGQQRVDAIRNNGGNAEFIAVDADRRESMNQLLQQTLESYGRVDILVNCAGTNSSTPYAEITDEDWHRVIDSQLTATHLGCQLFAPVMAKQENGGAILNIGSVTSHLPLSRVFVCDPERAGECALPGIFPSRAKPQDSRSATRREHHATDTDGPFRRTA
jgi:NAD(P)-dependent dehydrogenase (short-subunit alcohol dehydrogenase family)